MIAKKLANICARFLVTARLAGSALLLGFAAVLCWRYSAATRIWPIGWGGADYVLAMEEDAVAIRRLPPISRKRESAELANLVVHLRNDQIIWQFHASLGEVTGASPPRTKEGTPAYDIRAMFGDPELDHSSVEDFGKPLSPPTHPEIPPGEIQRQLLRALADPDKFIAAHYLLCRMSDQGYEKALEDEQLKFVFDSDRSSSAVDFDGLKVIGRTSWDESEHCRGEWTEIDPRQENAIEGLWHHRLDQRGASCSRRRLVLIAFVTFLVCWAAVFKQRMTMIWRRRHALCPICGYDIRSSPNKCPECGASRKPGRL
ncbi:MAG: hypothetical protein JWP03_443 [Phycisphaerales bacterium]|jgi:hypothetical protein|nr:hypothetical protein [Phycisphaerales bacterium]